MDGVASMHNRLDYVSVVRRRLRSIDLRGSKLVAIFHNQLLTIN